MIKFLKYALAASCLLIMLPGKGQGLPDDSLKNYPLQLPKPHKHHVYGYYDLVRELGLGYEYRFHPKLGWDNRINLIYPYSPVATSIHANDFAYNKGWSVTTVIKNYSFILKGFFSGISLSYASFGYKNKLAEPQTGYDKYASAYNGIASQVRDRESKQVSLGLLAGFHVPYKRLYLEPFVGLNIAVYNDDRITYHDPSASTYIYVEHSGNTLSGTIGIKLGYEWKHFRSQEVFEEGLQEFNRTLIQNRDTVMKLYGRYQVSEQVLDMTDHFEEDARRAVFKAYMLHYPYKADFMEKLNTLRGEYDGMIAPRIFKPGAYLDSEVGADGRRVNTRIGIDLFTHRRSQEYKERYELYRR